MDWIFPPELQERYDRLLVQIRSLQEQLGIEPRTIEQRYQDYLKKKEEEQRQAEELKKFEQLIAKRRPPPRWKA